MRDDARDETETAEVLPGVRELDHTADVGIVVRAPTLAELFHRAARGMFHLVYGDDGAGPARPRGAAGERDLILEAPDLPSLLVRWLRELLYVDESERARYAEASFEELADDRLTARVATVSPEAQPVRELKGVTYHDLLLDRSEEGWRARVIFDV